MRSGDAIIKIISVLVFIALLLYMGFALLDNVVNPLKTSTVSSVTIEDGIEVSGYIVRTETVLSGDESYVTVADDGDKVSVGQTIAVKYGGESSLERAARIRELQTQIEQIEQNLNGRKSQSELASDSILSLSKGVNSGNMTDIQTAVTGIETYIMGLNGSTENPEDTLNTLVAELESLRSQSSSDTSYIDSDYSGIFTSVTDGYESVTIDDLDNITPSALAALFQGKNPGPDSIGKVVTGIEWYFAAIMNTSDAERLSVGESCKIEFTNNFSETITMTVEYISSDENGNTAVIFSSNKYVSDIASLRELSGNIMFDSYTGIAVPKNAVHYDEDDNAFVYVLVGLQARSADIEILDEFEDYYVVSSQDGSLLRVGSEVITKGRDLYDGKVVQ